MAEAVITALAPWFGGKRTLAPEIVRELGPHRVYWEPFCGSMAVLLEKDRSRSETVNDMHGDLTNFAIVVASDQWEPLRERLRRTIFCEGLFHETRARLADGACADRLDRAYCWFVESWMGRNGVAGTRTSNTAFCVRYTSNGGDPAVRFKSAVESIEAWHERLQGVWILQRDAFEIIPRIDDTDETAIYCDPPYLTKGARYVHDFEDETHAKLAADLGRFKAARVVVSYYDDARLDGLYPGWTKRRLNATKAMVNQGRRDKGGAVKAPEVLLINGPSLAEGPRLF